MKSAAKPVGDFSVGFQIDVCTCSRYAFELLAGDAQRRRAAGELALAFAETPIRWRDVVEYLIEHISETPRPCGVAGVTTCSRVPLLTALRPRRDRSVAERTGDGWPTLSTLSMGRILHLLALGFGGVFGGATH